MEQRKNTFTPARILVFGFFAIIMIGALLLCLPCASVNGTSLSFLNALFTATSATCITGLAVVDTGTFFSRFGQTVIIVLIQIGGLGFMTMTTLITLAFGKKIGLRERMLIQESFNQTSLSGLVKLILHAVLFTLSFELIGGLVLSLRFLKDFEPARAFSYGFFHAISAFCNAGFDLLGQVYGPGCSMIPYATDSTVNLVLAVLVICGGLGFPVMMELIHHRHLKRFTLHTKIVMKTTIGLLLLGTILILMLEYNNAETLGMLSFSDKIKVAFFQAVVPRTAGFSSVEMSSLRHSTWFLMMILMFIGASPSSTGGGVKTTTFALIFYTMWDSLKGKKEIEMYERKIAWGQVIRAISIVTLALTWIYFITLIMSIFEKFDFLQIGFEVISAFGTVGLTTGITGGLTTLSKLLLILTMFVGRVGIFTITLTLMRNKTNDNQIKFVEEQILLG